MKGKKFRGSLPDSARGWEWQNQTNYPQKLSQPQCPKHAVSPSLAEHSRQGKNHKVINDANGGAVFKQKQTSYLTIKP